MDITGGGSVAVEIPLPFKPLEGIIGWAEVTSTDPMYRKFVTLTSADMKISGWDAGPVNTNPIRIYENNSVTASKEIIFDRTGSNLVQLVSRTVIPEIFDGFYVDVDDNQNIYINDMGNNIHKIDSNLNYVGNFPGGFSNIKISGTSIYQRAPSEPRINKYSLSGTLTEWLGWDGTSTAWHTTGTAIPGTADGQFSSSIFGIDLDSTGNIYVVDSLNHRIQKFNSLGNHLLTIGGTAIGTGNGQFNNPTNIKVDSLENFIVADSGNHRIQKFNSAGVHQWTIGGITAGSGNDQFDYPLGLAVDSTDNIYVLDINNKRIQIIDSSGTFLKEIDLSNFGGLQDIYRKFYKKS